MFRAIWIGAAVALAGCGSGEGDVTPVSNHGYGVTYDVQGPQGMRLRFAPVLTTADPLSNPIFLENIFGQVEVCMGVNAPEPFVIFVPDGSLGTTADGLKLYGEYITNPSLVLLYGTTSLDIPRHEFIHYLLDVSDGAGNLDHTSPFFKSRAEGGCA
jgi:hypothetical protein